MKKVGFLKVGLSDFGHGNCGRQHTDQWKAAVPTSHLFKREASYEEYLLMFSFYVLIKTEF